MKIKKVKFHAKTKDQLFCMVTYIEQGWFNEVEKTDLFSLEIYTNSYSSVAYNCRTNDMNHDIHKLIVLSIQM